MSDNGARGSWLLNIAVGAAVTVLVSVLGHLSITQTQHAGRLSALEATVRSLEVQLDRIERKIDRVGEQLRRGEE